MGHRQKLHHTAERGVNNVERSLTTKWRTALKGYKQEGRIFSGHRGRGGLSQREP